MAASLPHGLSEGVTVLSEGAVGQVATVQERRGQTENGGLTRQSRDDDITGTMWRARGNYTLIT